MGSNGSNGSNENGLPNWGTYFGSYQNYDQAVFGSIFIKLPFMLLSVFIRRLLTYLFMSYLLLIKSKPYKD